MGFILPKTCDYVDAVLSCDDAIEMTEKEYAAYVENPIKENLIIKPGMEPTYIRMRIVLPWRLSQAVEDMKLGMVKNRDGDTVSTDVTPRISWMHEEVRCAITEVINPGEIQFTRDAEGGASFDFVSQLLEMGVMTDLFNIRNNFKKVSLNNKKK